MCSSRQVRTIAQTQQASTAKNASASAPIGERPIAAPMSTTREPDRAVEHPPGAVRPRLEIAAPLAPDEEEEERDREHERDPEQTADRGQHRLERQHHHRERDQSHDRRARAPSCSRRGASRPCHGATNAEGGGDECRAREPEQPPARVGRGVEPRREHDARARRRRRRSAAGRSRGSPPESSSRPRAAWATSSVWGSASRWIVAPPTSLPRRYETSPTMPASRQPAMTM